MVINGYLSEFSLPEVFQLLEHGRKTGLLSINNLSQGQTKNHHNYYIWFSHGRIMAASNRLDNKGLVYLINQRGWLSVPNALHMSQSCPLTTPMGLCLKSQGALEGEQLKLLFYVQVIRQVCALFKLTEGWFTFDNSAKLPVSEMTGLSTPANQVTLVGLRAMKDWSVLRDKLPLATSTVLNMTEGKPQISLNSQEWQVWEFAQGTTSLRQISQHLGLSTEKVQQIAFRLIVIGLVKEIPTVEVPITVEPQVEYLETKEKKEISENFLQTLVSFLRGKLS